MFLKLSHCSNNKEKVLLENFNSRNEMLAASRRRRKLIKLLYTFLQHVTQFNVTKRHFSCKVAKKWEIPSPLMTLCVALINLSLLLFLVFFHEHFSCEKLAVFLKKKVHLLENNSIAVCRNIASKFQIKEERKHEVMMAMSTLSIIWVAMM